MLCFDFFELPVSCLLYLHHFFFEGFKELGSQQIWKTLIEFMGLNRLFIGFLKLICKLILLLIKHSDSWWMHLFKLFYLSLERLHLLLTLVIHVFHLAGHLIARRVWLWWNGLLLAVTKSQSYQPEEDLRDFVQTLVLQGWASTASILLLLKVKCQ